MHKGLQSMERDRKVKRKHQRGAGGDLENGSYGQDYIVETIRDFYTNLFLFFAGIIFQEIHITWWTYATVATLPILGNLLENKLHDEIWKTVVDKLMKLIAMIILSCQDLHMMAKLKELHYVNKWKAAWCAADTSSAAAASAQNKKMHLMKIWKAALRLHVLSIISRLQTGNWHNLKKLYSLKHWLRIIADCYDCSLSELTLLKLRLLILVKLLLLFTRWMLCNWKTAGLLKMPRLNDIMCVMMIKLKKLNNESWNTGSNCIILALLMLLILLSDSYTSETDILKLQHGSMLVAETVARSDKLKFNKATEELMMIKMKKLHRGSWKLLENAALTTYWKKNA